MSSTIHHADAESIRIESDECGFELHLTDTEGLVHVFNVHGVAVDLLAAVERKIAPWHREGVAVLAEMRAAGAFCCDPDESAGMTERVVAIREDGSYRVEPEDYDPYDPSDPKHRNYHSVHADIWDAREGK